jgi:hypothetical protein
MAEKSAVKDVADMDAAAAVVAVVPPVVALVFFDELQADRPIPSKSTAQTALTRLNDDVIDFPPDCSKRTLYLSGANVRDGRRHINPPRGGYTAARLLPSRRGRLGTPGAAPAGEASRRGAAGPGARRP